MGQKEPMLVFFMGNKVPVPYTDVVDITSHLDFQIDPFRNCVNVIIVEFGVSQFLGT
jgi:hypothetical protein